MNKTILIRYGEIFLKGHNKGFFEKALINNIKDSLSDMQYEFNKSQGRYSIDNYPIEKETIIIDRLKKIFGIHSISVAVKCKNDLEEIKKIAVEVAPKSGKFRVSTKRADKSIPMSSMQISAMIGGVLLDSSSELEVDLFDYDFDLNIDIRENNVTYIFIGKTLCAGGMPVGTAGNAMLLLSGGIDSPVAGYMMAKRGAKVFAVHYYSYPYTSIMAKEKVIDLAKIIKPYTGNIELNVVPFTKIQKAIHENCPPEFMITIMRRFMMRIAEKLAIKYDCGAIVTGESLGQVASQTMQSIMVTNEGINLPIYRPLIGMDKSEIINVANKIETYETSILPYEDCCTVFLPKNPVIRPKLDIIKKAESVLDFDSLIDEAIENIELIEI